ncbi:hypothetical protein HAX54_026035, partial [Datura stramonium]|nr:hypothetical protein [Datura stramonium]
RVIITWGKKTFDDLVRRVTKMDATKTYYRIVGIPLGNITPTPRELAIFQLPPKYIGIQIPVVVSGNSDTTPPAVVVSGTQIQLPAVVVLGDSDEHRAHLTLVSLAFLLSI